MAQTTANVSVVMRQILRAALRQIDGSKFKVGLLKDEYELVKRTSSGKSSRPCATRRSS